MFVGTFIAYIRNQRPLLLDTASGQVVGTYGKIPRQFGPLKNYFKAFSDKLLNILKIIYFHYHVSFCSEFTFVYPASGECWRSCVGNCLLINPTFRSSKFTVNQLSRFPRIRDWTLNSGWRAILPIQASRKAGDFKESMGALGHSYYVCQMSLWPLNLLNYWRVRRISLIKTHFFECFAAMSASWWILI